ncbi:serine protease [Geobacter sp.]|uniref:serine protease n=1 Tax=Geobacter sp. TaxID=46610 RepID=UPI0027B8E14C|nr:serine protease [Geobacter sp.]
MLVLCWTALFPTPSRALSPQEIFRKTEGKVLVLEVLDNNGKQLSAHTALLLDGEKAVTQCNLLEGASSLILRQGNKAFPTKMLLKDGVRNLCLLEAADFSGGQKLRDSDPASGSRVYAISNALGMGISISEGVVSGIREADGDTAIQFTAPIAPGSEGGGLFDEDGRLVGVIYYLHLDGQNVNFAQPARWVREIKPRAAATDAAASWRSKADELAKEEKWPEMAEIAEHWIEALPESLEARYYLAYAQKQLKDWAAAEKSYRELFRRDPTSPMSGIGLAGVLFEQRKHQEALETARATQTYHRENVLVWILIAYVEDVLGNTVAAKSAINKAAQLEPWNQQVLQGMVALGRRHKEWGMAIAAQSRLVESDPGNVATRLDLVDLLLAGGRTRKALNTIDKALELEPLNGDAWLLKGLALSASGRFREAVESLKKGLGLKPKGAVLGWKWLGDVYESLRLYPEAIAAYREALLLSPNDAWVRTQLGIALKDNLQLEEAVKVFEKLRQEFPEDPLPWRQVGYVYAYLAQPDKAIPAYEKSLGLDARQPKVWAALMETYHLADRMDDVKRSYQKLQALDQTWADYAYKRVLLPYGVTP